MLTTAPPAATPPATKPPKSPSSFPTVGARGVLQFDYRRGGFFDDAKHTYMSWKTLPGGAVQLTHLDMGPYWDYGNGMGPFHHWDLGDRTKPRLQGAIDAVQGVLPGLLRGLSGAYRYEPQQAFGTARNTYCIYEGSWQTPDNNIFHGTLDHRFPTEQPAVTQAGAALVDLMETFRKETKRHWGIPRT